MSETVFTDDIDEYGRFFVVTHTQEPGVHRRPICPGYWVGSEEWIDTDIRNEPQAVRATAERVWTAEIVQKFKDTFTWASTFAFGPAI